VSETWLPQEVLGIAALIPFVIGVAIIVVGVLTAPRYCLHTGRAFGTFLGFGLEFLLAAGLIRLASTTTFAMIGITASIIAARRMVLLGLGFATRVTG
jgi:hypothetical protein